MNRINTTVYTDIHTHILPGVDDGSGDMEETIKMLRMAYEEGIRTIIATPHYIPGRRNLTAEHLRLIFEEVSQQVLQLLPDMRMFLGNEIYFRAGTLEALKAGKALTLAETDYVLTEFSVQSEYKAIFQAVRMLTEAGYRPILAHVERYGCLYKKTNLFDDLIGAGAYIQINTESLIGHFFNHRVKFCRHLLEEGYVHFLGSDCHDTGFRKPLMRTAIEQQKAGCREQAYKIMSEHIERLLQNKWI